MKRIGHIAGASAAFGCLLLALSCTVDEAGGVAADGSAGSGDNANAGSGPDGGSSGSGAGSSSDGGNSGAAPAGGGGASESGTSGGGGSASIRDAEPLDAGQLDSGEPDVGLPDADAGSAVTYTSHIESILLTRCSPCHSALGEGGHNAATSYEDAARAADEILRVITSGSMPESGMGNLGCAGRDPGEPGCVTVEEFGLIQRWVEDGVLE
jgi:hypothetical protein